MSALAIRWLVIAVVAAAAMGWAYMQGIERESDRRDAVELKRVADEGKAYAKYLKKGREAVADNQRLRSLNRKYYRTLLENIANADPSTLTEGCPSAEPARPFVPSTVVLFSGRFVELYNDAWRGAGTLVPADPAGTPRAAGGTAAAGAEEILAHTAAETESCGADRKRYARLIKLLSAPPWSP